MCGTIYYCEMEGCTYETQNDDEEAMWCHLFEKHQIDFLSHINISCCRHIKTGIEKFAGSEEVCGVSRRSLERYQEKKNEAMMKREIKKYSNIEDDEESLKKRPEYVTLGAFSGSTSDRQISDEIGLTEKNRLNNRLSLYSPIMGKNEVV